LIKKRKLVEQSFLDYLNNYDIVFFFNEIWIKNPDDINLNIGGFIWDHTYENKHYLGKEDAQMETYRYILKMNLRTI
jgi:hypothetical protein